MTMMEIDPTNGMTLTYYKWELGRLIVWDAKCVDTLAPFHLPRTLM